MGFMGSTNYDNFFADYPTGGAAQIIAPRYPNNFSVLITQNADQNLMGSSAPMPQACLCGNGYDEGNQLPFPMLWPPMTTIDFEYTMTAPFTLFTATGLTGPISLQINFGLYGYNVPTSNLEAFLASWPAMQRIARTNRPLWAQQFTSISIPGLTA
jgi:hypothetical protein